VTPEQHRERDEADLRWFWCAAEGDLGLSGGADFERAASAVTGAPERCACQSAAPCDRRARRAQCPECRGLGVVVPTTFPSGNPPASPCGEPLWLRGVGMVSPREPAWMSLVGPAAMMRRRHRVVRLALAAMEPGHIRPLHAVHGPSPKWFFPADAPLVSVVLAVQNRQLAEKRATELKTFLGRLGGKRLETAQKHAAMLLGAGWRAYGRARGRVIEDERVPFVEDMAAIDATLVQLKAVADGAFPVPTARLGTGSLTHETSALEG